jgi:fucose 4-O-acetylase-like acetyltransferase
MKKPVHPRTKPLTMAAFAVALSAVGPMFFRGPLSLVSALYVPAVLVLFTKDGGLTNQVLTAIALLAVALLFFQAQIVFVLGYVLLSFTLRLLVAAPNLTLRLQPALVAGYTLLAAAVLFLGIRLTDFIFGVPLHAMMLRISGNNLWVYFGILLVEALLISGLNISFLKVLLPRVTTAWQKQAENTRD